MPQGISVFMLLVLLNKTSGMVVSVHPSHNEGVFAFLFAKHLKGKQDSEARFVSVYIWRVMKETSDENTDSLGKRKSSHNKFYTQLFLHIKSWCAK